MVSIANVVLAWQILTLCLPESRSVARNGSTFMTKKTSQEEFFQNLMDSRLFSKEEMATMVRPLRPSTLDGEAIAERLVAAGALTPYQAGAVREGRFEELLIGNYEVMDRLGEGGMGTVYKARHRRMKRIVAVKVLSRRVAQSEKLVRRFQREVEAVARLSHPNIVMAYDADESEVGHFLVMEFVNGRDLASEVQHRGSLPIAEAVDCIMQAGRALHYAHEQGIIHRDIKPANLLRDVHGVVKVADLGLARFNDSFGRPGQEMAALTQAGSIMGTVDFMSPEQALGLTNIDHRADIYSLGCTLYFLLTGRPPYPGSSLMAILLKHREAPPPSLCVARSDIPETLESIFRRMVAKSPNERFSSMSELVQALESLSLTQLPQPSVCSGAQQPAAPSLTRAEPGVQPDRAEAQGLCPTMDLIPPPSSRSERTVLLVEPSRSQAVIIRNYLQGLGFSDITTAPSGQKALEAAVHAPPSVVLSAMHLHDMTGLELAHRLRADESLTGVGFVLISSGTDAQDVKSFSPTGDIIRLTKPFSAEQLAKSLAAAIKSLSALPADAPSSAASGIRVLVVDDSASARSHIRRTLKAAGLDSIAEAKDGEQAVAFLKKENFDLVVTDYNMPHLDGLGVIDFIRRHSSTPSLPVILVTTETDPAKLEAVRQLGVSAICDKSFPIEVIRTILQRREEGHV
jgi:serine/threonine protein kinase